MVINNCPNCLALQRKIDRLTEENLRLQRALGRQKRQEKEGLFGSSTPSAKLPVKPNTPEKEDKSRPGARPGHQGAGRKRGPGEPDQPVTLISPESERCPICGGGLRDKGHEDREVLESRPVKVERIVYRLPKKYCPHCRKTHKTKASEVLPRSLYGNQLLANAAVMHYLNGIPMGRLRTDWRGSGKLGENLPPPGRPV